MCERAGIVIQDALQAGMQHQYREHRAGLGLARVKAVEGGGQIGYHPRSRSSKVGLPVDANPFDVDVCAAMAGIEYPEGWEFSWAYTPCPEVARLSIFIRRSGSGHYGELPDCHPTRGFGAAPQAV